MGRNSKNSKKKSSGKELLNKKGFAKRQKQKELAKSTQSDCENKSIDPPSSVELLSVTNSEINTEMVHCLPQIEEEKRDNGEVKIEAKEDVLNETIECCKDNKGLISVHANNNIEEPEGCTEENICNKTFEHCENNEDLVSTLPQIEEEKRDNGEVKIEAKEDVLNETIECCKDNEGLISVHANNNIEEPEGCTEEDICNKTFEHCENNKDLVSTLPQIEEEKRDNINEEKIVVNDEENVINETIECKDKKDLISVNINIEEMKEGIKEDICNKTVEHCEENKDLVSIDIDNVEKIEDSKQEGMHNQNIECSENNKDNYSDAFSDIKNLRCIINISYVYCELQKVYTNHMDSNGINCDFKYWKFVNYRRHGLLTQLFFKCQKCHYEANIWSEPVETETPDINAVAVAASIATGMGYSRSNQLFASMGIVYMSEEIYNKYKSPPTSSSDKYLKKLNYNSKKLQKNKYGK